MSDRVRLGEWYQDWRANRQTERLGQAFCNDFIRNSWVELYYETNNYLAAGKITAWLYANCYHDSQGFYVPGRISK